MYEKKRKPVKTARGEMRRVLRENPQGLTSNQVVHLIRESYHITTAATHVLLCQMVKEGRVLRIGKQICECCRRSSMTYKISRSDPSEHKDTK